MIRPEQATDDRALREISGTGHAIRVDPAAVTQLQAVIGKGLKALPRRGAEVGGLLVGSAIGKELFIEGIIEIPCDYGPFFRVSAERDTVTALVPGNEARLIGFFRSHTRDEAINIHEEKALLAELLPDARLIWIVRPIGPGQSTCYIYVRKWRRQWIRATEVTFPSLTMLPPSPASRFRLKWLLPPVIAAALIAGYALSRNAISRVTPQYSVQRSQSVAPLRLGLRLDRQGYDVRVRWDSVAPEVASANSAKLVIREGSAERSLDLDAEQLRSGNVLYVPTGKDVLFRLEIPGVGAESVRFLSGSDPRPANDHITPLPLSATQREGSAQPSRIVSEQPHEASRTASDQPRVSPRPFTPAITSPASLASASDTATVPPPPSIPVQVTASAGVPLPINIDSAAPSQVPRPMVPETESRQPLSGTKAVQITAAHAVKKMPVQLPPDVKALLQREESVSVRVTVDKTGKVVNATPEGADGALRQMLAHFAVGAVQHWTFEPARREGEAINSTVTLTFRFGPGATNR